MNYSRLLFVFSFVLGLFDAFAHSPNEIYYTLRVKERQVEITVAFTDEAAHQFIIKNKLNQDSNQINLSDHAEAIQSHFVEAIEVSQGSKLEGSINSLKFHGHHAEATMRFAPLNELDSLCFKTALFNGVLYNIKHKFRLIEEQHNRSLEYSLASDEEVCETLVSEPDAPFFWWLISISAALLWVIMVVIGMYTKRN